MATDKKKLTSPSIVKAATADDKVKALQSAMAAIEKQFGKGAIMRLGDNHTMEVETLSTGSLSLDIALGGGLPIGRIAEIYGPESSGKTTVALSVIACAQRAGKTCAFSHIPARHFKMVRYYGFLANRKRGTLLPKVYEALEMTPREKPQKPGFAVLMKAFLGTDPYQCILCKRPAAFCWRRGGRSRHKNAL